MNWFECDNDGNILLNINDMIETIKNTDILSLKQKQIDILTAIQNITSSGGSCEISTEQLNQILSAIQAIPSDTLVNNQNDIITKLLTIIASMDTTKSNTDSMKNTMDVVYGELEDSVSGVLKAGETSITLISDGITEDINLDVYTSIYSVNPLTIIPSNGSVILTFKEQSEDMGVKVTFKRAVNWSNLPIVTIDGIAVKNQLKLISHFDINFNASTLPYNFYAGSVVIYNKELHILGSYNGSNQTKHYKWNGSTWTEVSTLPYEFIDGSAVIFDNEIHILGGISNNTSHYKYNGSTWTNVSTLPYNFYQGYAVLFNNEIHIMGGNGNTTKHYKWNGSTWTEVSTLPYNFYDGASVVMNDEIHIMGGSGQTGHYKWNGSTWTSVSTLPYDVYQGNAVVFNNEIHILGSYNSTYSKSHYKFNGSNWVELSVLPYKFANSSAIVYNNAIHILGSYDDYLKHYVVYAKSYIVTQ